MSILLSDYRSQSFEELVTQAYDHGFDNAGQFTPAELIFEMVCARANEKANSGKRVEITAEGLLEILSDGFGFLRSPVSNFAAGADDIDVSPAQIRRFNLRTGDWVQGTIRAPRDNERYFALLRIEEVNGRSPELEKKRLLFSSQSLELEPKDCVDVPEGIADVRLGQRILVQLQTKQHPAPALFSLLKSCGSVVMALLNYATEDAAVLQRAWPEGVHQGRMLFSSKGSNSEEHLQQLELAIERSQRLVEQCQDVHLVIVSANTLATSTRFVTEQQGKHGGHSLGVEKVRWVLSQARNLKTTGSLTIWMCAHQHRLADEQSVLQQIEFEVEHRVQVTDDGSFQTLD